MYAGSNAREMASISPDRSDDLLDLNCADSMYGSYSAGNTPEPSFPLDSHTKETCFANGTCSEGNTPEPGGLPAFTMNGSEASSFGAYSAVTTPEPNVLNPLGLIGSGLYSPTSLQSIASPSASILTQPNGGDINEVVTQISTNLRKLADLIEKNGYNGVPSPVTTPSPQTHSFTSIPANLGDPGFLFNDVALKNLQNLAQIAAIGEPERSISSMNSPTPLESAGSTPTPPINFPLRQGKVNIMQIRCKFGQLGSGKGQFSSPHGFCLGVDEEIVVADTNNHRICVFDKGGEFKTAFGVAGKDEGQLWYPRKVAFIRNSGSGNALASPRYVICDRGSERSRMQIFTRSGHFVRKIAIRYIDIVAGLAITPQGHIVAVDSVSPTVFVIADTGDLLRWFDCSDHMREPSDVAVANNEFYICDFKGHCVVVFSEEGQYLRRIGHENLTNFPNGIDISDEGDILIGDSHGNRFHVVVFDKNGTHRGEFECPYVKVSRCCGLKITSEGYVVTLAKNNHHVLVLNTLYIM